jgi:hypothetical protein
MYKTIKNILKIIAVTAIAFSFVNAAPIPAKFYTSTLAPQVGDTIEFELKVEGSTSNPVYTAIANLEYDKELLTFKDSAFQQGWVSVTPDDVTDTKNGLIKRTAGYPSGLKQLASIIKYTFVAKAPGQANVRIIGSSAYDANNTDVGLQNKSITINIGGKNEEPPKEVVPQTTKTDKVVAVKKLPQSISLELVGATALVSNKEYNFLVKETFSVEQETVGTTTFAILDQTGKEVIKNDIPFTNTKSFDLPVNIPPNNLTPGDYKLVVSVIYDNQSKPSRVVWWYINRQTTLEGLLQQTIKSWVHI